MRRSILFLILLFFSTGLLFSGAQTVSGYYSNPYDYGFYQIYMANMQISVSMIIMGMIMM